MTIRRVWHSEVGTSGDPALIAPRKAFSLTYPDEPTLASVKGAVEQIRALCVDALKPLAAVLTALRLKPVAPETEDRKKTFVFKYVFCPRKEADIKVECDGALRRLLTLIQTTPADDVIVALRKVVTLTFEEVFDYRAYAKLLFDVRRLIAAALVPCNPLLEEIEVAPVAAPQRPFQEDDDEDSDQEPAP